MTVGSLFTGIGGFDLGFERAGFEILWMCEKNEFCQRILNKHWPHVPVYEDVRRLYTEEGERPETPEVLIGGFPCQDISLAGKGAGLDGERSGLWWEYYRIIGEVRPRYAVLENVPALVNRGLPAILGALSEIGYDAEWEIVSAAALGAPHIRERIFIVAYPNGQRKQQPEGVQPESRRWISNGSEAQNMADTLCKQPKRGNDGAEWRQWGAGKTTQNGRARNATQDVGWKAEPDVGRVADGVPDRVDRLRGLGNAVVPDVAEYVARCIERHAAENHSPSTHKR